jgi:hypothetical protein
MTAVKKRRETEGVAGISGDVEFALRRQIQLKQASRRWFFE